MTRRARPDRGFTLIEMMVVVAIIVIVAGLVFFTFGRRTTPVHKLVNVELELKALLHGARQTALATGREVSVLVYPDLQTSEGTGRIVVYQDDDGTFYQSAGPINFEDYNCPTLPGNVLTTMEIPRNLAIDMDTARGHLAGPPGGQAFVPDALVAPFANIDTSSGCPFCRFSSTACGGNHTNGVAGAIVFDASGRASFRAANDSPPIGYPFDLVGGALTVRSPVTGEYTTLVVASPTGAVQALSRF